MVGISAAMREFNFTISGLSEQDLRRRRDRRRTQAAVALAVLAGLVVLAIRPLQLEPASHDFGEREVGSTGEPVNFTLVNSSDLPAVVTLDIQGDAADDFGILSSCTDIPAQAQCVALLQFKPTGEQSRSARLIAFDTSGRVLASSELRGTGVTGVPGERPLRNLVFDPSPLVFREAQLNSPSQRQRLRILNEDREPFEVAVRLAESRVFSIAAQTCGSAVLEVGGECTVDIDFDPQAVGDHSVPLSIMDDGQHDHPVFIQGTVTGPPPVSQRSVTITPSPLRFPAAAVGGQAQRRALQIRNNDSEPFRVAVRLADSPVFRVLGQTCSATELAAGGVCSVDIGFDPRTAGEHRVSLEVADDRGHVNRVRIAGTVRNPPPPGMIEFAPNPVVFAPQATGSTSNPQIVLLTNRTGRTFKASYAAFDSSTAANFVIAGACNGFFFLADSNIPCSEQVRFRPRSGGAQQGSLSLLDDNGKVVGTLRLEGAGREFGMRVEPREIDFSPPSNRTRTVTVTNVGEAAFVIGRARVVAQSDAGAFEHVAAACQFQALQPTTSCSVPASYTAGLSGDATRRSAELEIEPNGMQPVRVRLIWNRPREPVIRASQAALEFGQVAVNTTRTLEVTFTNVGEGTAEGIVVGFMDSNTPFSVASNNCSTVPPQGRCVVAVAFRPTKAGAERATLRLGTLIPPAQLATVTVSGSGFADDVSFVR